MGDVTLRLSVEGPVAGVTYSLQDKDSVPVNARVAGTKTILFEIPVRLEEGKTGPRFLGDFVRTEGKTRRFVYVATGQQAGQHLTAWSRRAKIDLPEPTAAMMKLADKDGLVLETSYAGTDAEGGPTCATVKVEWKVVKQ